MDLLGEWTAPDAAQRSDADFLAEVRAFFDHALTPELRAAGRNTLGVYSDVEAGEIWRQRLYERGWVAPAWPAEWGGPGWTARQRFLFDRECALNDAPVLFASGVRTIGPLLIEMGGHEQRARYLPAILSGQDLWCQGFSEPGAGSDLAAISTRAVRDDDTYVITGSKIWTTGAHIANRMFAIVRTADGARRQEGLTFLLIDMETPGITVRPIVSLSGEHELNEVFFDGARVPVTHRVGEEGEGWAVAKRLMQLARANNTPAALVRRAHRKASLAIAALDAEARGSLPRRLAALEVELEAYESMELRALPDGRPKVGEETTPSMLKLIGTDLHQRISELTMEAAGPYADAALASVGMVGEAADSGARAMAKHLAVRAASIYSGTSETQRNVMARQLLGPGF
jgi:acyl-CoA dehydrogenase